MKSSPLPRLRHVCLIAPRLEPAVRELQAAFDLAVAYRDPLVERWGIQNAMLPVGASFVEVCAPIRADAPVHRFLARRPGGGGYILVMNCDNLDERRRHLQRRSIRLVTDLELDNFRTVQTHPRDSGACMLEFNTTDGGADWQGPDAPAGPDWQQAGQGQRVRGLAGVEIRALAPERLSAHWADLMQAPLSRNLQGQPCIELDGGSIRFAAADDDEGEGLASIDLASSGEPGANSTFLIAGVKFRLMTGVDKEQ